MNPEQRTCEALKDRYPMADKDVLCKRKATWSAEWCGGRVYYCGRCARYRRVDKDLTDWRRI